MQYLNSFLLNDNFDLSGHEEPKFKLFEAGSTSDSLARRIKHRQSSFPSSNRLKIQALWEYNPGMFKKMKFGTVKTKISVHNIL